MRSMYGLSKSLRISVTSCFIMCLAMVFIMDPDAPSVSWQTVGFSLHQFLGMIFLVVATAYLVLLARRQRMTLWELYPWLTNDGFRALLREVGQVRALRLRRTAALLRGLAALYGLATVAIAFWASWLTVAGRSLANDLWLSHIPLLLSLSTIGYLLGQVPWRNRQAREGWKRELNRLMQWQTYRLSSALRGIGIATGLVATLSGLWLVMLSGLGAAMTSDMWLPQAHVYTASIVMIYLPLHGAVALLRGMIGYRQFVTSRMFHSNSMLPYLS